LTAEEIFDRADVEDDTEIILAHFRQHLHDQHWREVLLLLVSKLKGKKAQKAILAVLDAGSEYEQWLHRDLLFAGWCLTEDPPELTVVAADWVGDILDRLVGLEVEDSDRIGGRIRGEVEKILHCFGETTIEQHVWAKLQTQEDRVDRCTFLRLQASLGQESEAIQLLLNLLRNQHGAISLIAAETLVQLGYSDNNVINRLLDLMCSEQPFIFIHAAKVLYQTDNFKDELVQKFLLSLNEENPLIRIGSAQILVQTRNISKQLLSSLLSLLKDENLLVRCNAVSALGELGNNSLDVISCLLVLLGDKHPFVRSQSAESLMHLGNNSSEVISCLLALLLDENSNVRSSGALALVYLGNSSSEVINCLIALLDREDLSAHYSSTFNALGKLTKISNIIHFNVLQWIKQNPNHIGIGSAIDCLWSIVVE
jgi:HEAT repeat protein